MLVMFLLRIELYIIVGFLCTTLHVVPRIQIVTTYFMKLHSWTNNQSKNGIMHTYRSGIPCSRPEVANNYFQLFFPFAVDKFRFSRFTQSPWLRVLKVFSGFACRILAVG